MPRPLSDTRLQILRRLATRAEGPSWPTIRDIAEDTDLPHDKVYAAVWSLHARGHAQIVGWASRRHPTTRRWQDVRTFKATEAGRSALAAAEGVRS